MISEKTLQCLLVLQIVASGMAQSESQVETDARIFLKKPADVYEYGLNRSLCFFIPLGETERRSGASSYKNRTRTSSCIYPEHSNSHWPEV